MPNSQERLSPLQLLPGQRVTWRHWPRGGWGYLERIPATVVRIGPKRVTIEVPLKAGGTKRVSVQPENL